MAIGEEQEGRGHGKGKGFDGLSSLVSEVDAAIERSRKKAHEASLAASSQPTSRTTPPTKNEQPKSASRPIFPPSQPTGGPSVGKWLFAIAIVIGIFWLANQSGSNRQSSSASNSRTAAQLPSRPAETKPSVGRNNVLQTDQIRYCLAEKIRLEAAESVVNNYDDSDVDRLNGYINDYNSRCAEYRYRSGALEGARRGLEPYRSQLQAEGRNRFSRSSLQATKSSSSTKATPRSVPIPDATVQAIQRRLTKLGYEAGVADGLYGKKTQMAIQAFQRSNGNPVDGGATESLLAKLDGADSQSRIAKSANQSRASAPLNSGGESRPENAVVDVYGTGWTCKRGYYKSGDGCAAVQVPRNATVDVFGTGWACKRGYYKAGDGCAAVQVPTNATVDVFGTGWVCKRGYYKAGDGCAAVQVPRNATVDVFGTGWECKRGYYKSGDGCAAVQVPRNATVDVFGTGWECKRGYVRSGDRCEAI